MTPDSPLGIQLSDLPLDLQEKILRQRESEMIFKAILFLFVIWVAIWIIWNILKEVLRKWIAGLPDEKLLKKVHLSPKNPRLYINKVILNMAREELSNRGLDNPPQEILQKVLEVKNKSKQMGLRWRRLWQLIILCVIAGLICFIVLSAPKYVLVPREGAYLKMPAEKYPYFTPSIDWSIVAQRGIPVLIVGGLLIYILRDKKR